jgi:hypothetical protein
MMICLFCQEPNYVYDGDYEYDEYVPNGGAVANGGPPKVRPSQDDLYPPDRVLENWHSLESY